MSSSAHVSGLIQQAQQEGVLSAASAQVLSIVDLGGQIQAGLGVHVDDVQASEVVLVTMMPDDSGSIAGAGNEDVVRSGHNLVLEALLASTQRDTILAHTRYLNGTVLFPYSLLDQAVQMTRSNYQATQGTPLYDQTVVLLGTVLAKAQEFAQNGVPVRTVTLLITDGSDMHSVRHKARDVASIVGDMRRSETHIVAGLGIDDGSTDFRHVFREMGIEDRWIMTPGNSTAEIRAAFQLFSQSAVRASQPGARFAQAGLGGFGG